MLRRCRQILVPDILVDHLPQPLTARFGSKRETGLADLPNQRHEFRGERPHPHGWERDRDPVGQEPIHQRRKERLHLTVVAGAQRQE